MVRGDYIVGGLHGEGTKWRKGDYMVRGLHGEGTTW